MASGPITSWQVDRETVERVADFIFLGSKITADGDCCNEIKTRKTALRLGENNSKQRNRQRIHLKNIQSTPAAQFQKNK